MDNGILTEKDLEYLFWNEHKHKKKNPKRQIFLGIFYFVLLTALIFVVINFRSLLDNITYWYNNEFKTTSIDNTEEVKSITIDSNNIKNQTSNDKLPSIDDNSLNIPIINVKAPISWKVVNNPTDVADGLSKGLIHIAGTALPGEVGNVFVTGHSSNYIWAKGNYNNVFALLNRVVIGDMVQIKYQNINYLYKVSEIRVVEPSDGSPLQNTTDSRLTLMTCTPVGTSLRRLIVVAEQVYPSPSTNKSSTSQSGNNTLPNVR